MFGQFLTTGRQAPPTIESEFDASLASLETRIVDTIRREQPGEARRKVERMIERNDLVRARHEMRALDGRAVLPQWEGLAAPVRARLE